MSPPFASLNAGMLVRKGAASPSLEAPPAPLRLRPIVVSSEPTTQGPAAQGAAAKGPHVDIRDGRARSAPPKPAAAPPTPHPSGSEVAACNSTAAPSNLAGRPAGRAGARLTHEQMRALRLAALLLDRPQQELLASGLDLKLEALACGPLAECACFKAFTEKLAAGR